jgi:Ca-activated chloride channel homolog
MANMRARIIALLLIFLSVFLQSPGPKTQASQQASQDEDTIKVDATLVNIPVTVSDPQSRYIPNLRAEDFELYENNVRQQIEFFTNDNVPFSVALVIDVSGSTRENLQPIQEAARAFVSKLRSDDRVAIITFSRDLELECDFTSDRGRLNRAIDNIQWGGSTRLYDAVYATMIDKLKKIDGRKAMILLTDGEDTRSRLSADEAIDSALEAGAIGYVLQYPPEDGMNPFGRNRPNGPWGRDPRQDRYPDPQNPRRNPQNDPRGNPFPFPFPFPQRPRRDPGRGRFPLQQYLPGRFGENKQEFQDSGSKLSYVGYQGRNGSRRRDVSDEDFLQKLVDETGGTLYAAEAINDLSGLAGKIAEELRHVYVLGFYPTTPLEQGGNRQIKVRMARRADLKLHYKTSYDAGDQHPQSRDF